MTTEAQESKLAGGLTQSKRKVDDNKENDSFQNVVPHFSDGDQERAKQSIQLQNSKETNNCQYRGNSKTGLSNE